MTEVVYSLPRCFIATWSNVGHFQCRHGLILYKYESALCCPVYKFLWSDVFYSNTKVDLSKSVLHFSDTCIMSSDWLISHLSINVMFSCTCIKNDFAVCLGTVIDPQWIIMLCVQCEMFGCFYVCVHLCNSCYFRLYVTLCWNTPESEHRNRAKW